MIAYVDSSVLLRLVLEQPGQLSGIEEQFELVTSTLTQAECLRAIDNAVLCGSLTVDDSELRRAAVFDKLRGLTSIRPSPPVLARAESSFPSAIGTLDAIHLATALAWRDQRRAAVRFATHDAQQARAARAVGLEVLGV